MVILGVENRRACLEGLARDGYRGHAASDDAVSLEHEDPGVLVFGGVLAEEMGQR